MADESVAGLGRLGTHFWGFCAQGVVPDLVTVGRALGNGHPVAAVITTRTIADKFAASGVEYFNTVSSRGLPPPPPPHTHTHTHAHTHARARAHTSMLTCCRCSLVVTLCQWPLETPPSRC